MKVKLGRQGHRILPRLIRNPELIILFSILVIVLFPVLACNLPSRQEPLLIFPTDQSMPALPDQPISTSEATLWPATPELPALPTQTAGPLQSTYQFWGLQTATPGPGLPQAWMTPDPETTLSPFTYWTQPGDTLTAVAARFGVNPSQVSPAQPGSGFLLAGQQLTIPNVLGEAPYPSVIMPDSVIVYSPEAAGFSIEDYVTQAGGFLSTFQEEVDKEKGEWLTGAQIVRRVALDTSINPKVLLAFLEFRSGWVRGQPTDPGKLDFPIGFYVPEYKGLYLELALTAKMLNIGYYGWRTGALTDLTFPDYSHVRLAPGLNAGSVAVQSLTSRFYRDQGDWVDAIHGQNGLLATYQAMFGDPWKSAASVEPLFPQDLRQPDLELPFAPGESWALTSGPHIAWNTGTPRGALDFSPIILLPPCAPSPAWVTASAPGLVVRTGRGVVALDLDGDGLEQTGWVLIYMHIAERDRVSPGTRVELDTPLGHPSCEGGLATGTNIHLARKYNGEWLTADGPLPMVLSGWIAHEGKLSYEGTLEKDGQVVSAKPDGSSGSTIRR